MREECRSSEKRNIGLLRGSHKPPRCRASLSHHQALAQARLRECPEGKWPWKLQSRQQGHGELRNEKRQKRREAENNASEVRSRRESVLSRIMQVESSRSWVGFGLGLAAWFDLRP